MNKSSSSAADPNNTPTTTVQEEEEQDKEKQNRNQVVKLFYNMYVNPSSPERSVNIAHEQLHQMENSTLLQNHYGVEILYTIMESKYPL